MNTTGASQAQEISGAERGRDGGDEAHEIPEEGGTTSGPGSEPRDSDADDSRSRKPTGPQEKRLKEVDVGAGDESRHSARGPDTDGDGDAGALVVITGGSRGIGRSCVQAFARRGARVLFTYCSNPDAAARVEQSFEPRGRVQARRLDQGDFDSVQAFASEVQRWRAGRPLDTLVNNAALGVATVSNYSGLPTSPSAKGSDTGEVDAKSAECMAARRRADEDSALMRVNALGPMWVTEALLPMMRPVAHVAPRAGGGDTVSNAVASPAAAAALFGKATQSATSLPAAETARRRRTVLFVGSVGGGSQSVFPGFRAADAMSKAAVAYACKHFAARRRQLAAPSPATTRGANTNSAADGVEHTVAAVDVGGSVDFMCLCPGATLTDMFQASTLDKLEGPEELQRFLRALPQGRLMLPDEVAEAVHWLCSSPAAAMFHGAVIDASAGLAVRPGALTEYSL